MLLKEWEIWYTFATYFIEPIGSLEDAAKNLVQSGLLECAFISNGKFFWPDNSVLTSGYVHLSLDSSRSNASFQIKPSAPENNYSREALFQSIYFRFAELKQYRQGEHFPPKYVRGHLGECQLIYNKDTYFVYPIIKLYETGVVIVELRIGSPKGNIELRKFIEEFVNLYKKDFEDILVPPALRLAGQHAYALSEKNVNPIIARVGSFLLDSQLRKYLEKNKQIRISGDFEFELVHLWGEYMEKSEGVIANQEDPKTESFSISELANTIFGAVSVSISGLRKGKSLLVKPNTVLTLGDFWSGRPHIHLLRFEGQGVTAQQNEKRFQNAFGWIMGGIYIKDSTFGKKYLPTTARDFDDYGAYIAEQGTLWAWSKRGLSQSKKWEVPNRGNLVYFNQSQCELLEYGQILHRQLFESVSNPQSVEAALKASDNLVKLESAMSEVSGYREISNLLNRGWRDMRVDKLQVAISDMIGIRQTEASVQEGRNVAAWQIVLSIIFGVIAVPGFASEFVKPIWKLINLWKPNDPNAEQVWFFLIALLIVGIPILLLVNRLKKNQK